MILHYDPTAADLRAFFWYVKGLLQFIYDAY